MLPFVPFPVLGPSLQADAAGGGVFPAYTGDPEAEARVAPWLEGAMRSTEAFAPWPRGPWRLFLHEDDAGFEQATGAPPARSAGWVGSTLHLRPWARLQRRDAGAVLRHELTHRRLADRALPRWQEEAVCLWAESHTQPPAAWPPEPAPALQKRLDAFLTGGATAAQRWAYAWLRAWLEGRSLPEPPPGPAPDRTAWQAETRRISVVWPPERLPRTVIVDGRTFPWKSGAHFRFEGSVRFGPGMPVSRLEGEVVLEGAQGGWRLTWSTDPGTWVAAAAEGELGRGALFEAQRALAAVLRLWVDAHPAGNHPDGSFCPLTHCAVVRGQPSPEALRAAAEAPVLDLAPDRACFTGSQGGVSLSPREVWGHGSIRTGAAAVVPGDRWAVWSRAFTAAQVRSLKAAVGPGLLPGQRGLRLGLSGPYAVEALRLAAGRAFGWTAWPSNACEGELRPDGSLLLRGHGWGHNVGLCLATAVFRAGEGARAEAILEEAFGPPELHLPDEPADP